MDLIRSLRRWTVTRPRVLVIDAPGTTALRWTVEEELLRRGWRTAESPAETDLLLVLGTPGGELSAAVDVVWSQVPEPRHRVTVERDRPVAAALDAAVEELLDVAAGDAPGRGRPDPAELLAASDPSGTDHSGMDHSGHGDMDPSGHGDMDPSGHRDMDHSGMDHSGMDHSGHGGMDVAGLPMAGTAPDRDGLQLDALQVSLGPVLAGWPTGLLLRGQLQGDVLTGVQLSWVDAQDEDPGPDHVDGETRLEVLDRLARFLDVAGWPLAARDARRARTALRDPRRTAEGHRLAGQVTHRVRRSRTLAWSVRGIGAVDVRDAAGLHGDVLDRVRRMCDLAGDPGTAPDPLPELPLEGLAEVLEGAELAAARLVVASLPLTRHSARQRAAAVDV